VPAGATPELPLRSSVGGVGRLSARNRTAPKFVVRRLSVPRRHRCVAVASWRARFHNSAFAVLAGALIPSSCPPLVVSAPPRRVPTPTLTMDQDRVRPTRRSDASHRADQTARAQTTRSRAASAPTRPPHSTQRCPEVRERGCEVTDRGERPASLLPTVARTVRRTRRHRNEVAVAGPTPTGGEIGAAPGTPPPGRHGRRT
jgi:hypothetical protein